jgi:2-desacetyl-2-hydroxyethyl bacteriochlorophyllide A dehydrogenase
VVSGPGRVELTERPDPTPGPHDVVLAVGGCGLCGTDIHLLDGELPYPFPVVPGHEFYGEVVAVGAEVLGLTVGLLVAANPNIPCRRCAPCRGGRSNLCENYSAIGVTTDGAFAEFVRVPAELCFVLPSQLSLVSAPLVEPLSCVLHGVDRLPRRPGESYLVYGAGAIGLLMARTLSGISDVQVDVVDPNADRLPLAQSLGMRVADSADELDRPQGWDTVIDCTGAPAAVSDALPRVRRGGTLMLFGVAPVDATIAVKPFGIYRNEISIIGSMAVLDSFDRAVTQLAAWGSDVEALVTHAYDLADHAAAVDTFRSGAGLKVLLRPAVSSATSLVTATPTGQEA